MSKRSQAYTALGMVAGMILLVVAWYSVIATVVIHFVRKFW